MDIQATGFQIRDYPRSRRLVTDAGEWNRRKHIIHVLGEFDVTRARSLIRDHADRTGEKLSFTAFVAACVGRTVAIDRSWHAYRQGRRLILFDDVDIGTLIEREVEGQKLATFHVIRKANEKSVRDIHLEIRKAQGERVEDRPGIRWWNLFLALPGFLRRPLYWWIERHPDKRKELSGTVVITAIGMFANGAGWGIPIPSNTLSITVGGIGTKPGIVEGRIEPREFLSMTVSFDHDIVDGAPAARFTARLRDLIEDASLIDVPDAASHDPH